MINLHPLNEEFHDGGRDKYGRKARGAVNPRPQN